MRAETNTGRPRNNAEGHHIREAEEGWERRPASLLPKKIRKTIIFIFSILMSTLCFNDCAHRDLRLAPAVCLVFISPGVHVVVDIAPHVLSL